MSLTGVPSSLFAIAAASIENSLLPRRPKPPPTRVMCTMTSLGARPSPRVTRPWPLAGICVGVHISITPFLIFKNGVMEMWTPTQIPASGQGLVTRGLGLAPKDVIVHITRVGGGFGRRGSNEFSIEAAAIAKRLEGTPVKLMWRREDDFAHDNYRSNGWHYFTAGLDGGGKVVALHDAFVKMQGGPGDMSASGFPFIAISGSQVKSSKLPAGIPTGYWRAPVDNGNTWATQCFVDELAHAAGRDPLAFTLDLLASIPHATGRGFDAAKMTRVLKRATEMAGWGKPRP